MKLTKLLFLILFLSFKGYSQEAVLTSSGEKVVLNYLSSLGGTISGTLTTKAGIINTGTISNTGSLINNGTLTNNGNATITGTLTIGAVVFPNSNGSTGQVLTANSNGQATWSTASGGISSVGSISVSSTTNGASITSGEINLAPADESNGGIVTNGNQTFAGVKTFNSELKLNSNLVATGSIIGKISVFGSEITSNLTINNSNYTDYMSRLLVCNASSPITITINNSTELPTGFNLVVLQKSSTINKITFSAISPAIITNISNQVSTLGQYALASLLHVGGGIFIISGDLQ
jgi:hypothetical protein